MSHDTHTAREKAEAYVRGKLPELEDHLSDSHQRVWRRIELQHWLRVLGERRWRYINQGTYFGAYNNDNDCEEIKFNLTTGQPATEADYQAFNDIVGV